MTCDDDSTFGDEYKCNKDGAEKTLPSKTIRMCESFAKKLYGDNLNKPTTMFDSCGLIMTNSDDVSYVVIPSENEGWETAE